MKSGLRGGKPRNMATMSHGGKTSRGAGAAQRGYDYDVYRKGGKVKKYAEGGALRDEKGDYKRDPLTGTREYASFSDWMGDLFGKGKKAPESKSDYSAGAVKRESLPAPKSSSEENTGAGDRTRQEAMDREEASRASRPRATESLPTRPTSQQRRMARRAPPPAPPRPSDTDVMKDIVKDMTREERVRKAEMPSEIYRKGGSVKMAGGGTCRGMGAATKGGKYKIK